MKKIVEIGMVALWTIMFWGCDNVEGNKISTLKGENILPFGLNYYQTKESADSIMATRIDGDILSLPYKNAEYYEYKLRYNDQEFKLHIKPYFYNDSLYKIDIRNSYGDPISELSNKKKYAIAYYFFEMNNIDFSHLNEYYDRLSEQYNYQGNRADKIIFWPSETQTIIIFEDKNIAERLLNIRLKDIKNNVEGNTIIENSAWDGSVSQVKKFLKNNLKDPKSYESIEWSEVEKISTGYRVRHKYRAKNSFGGYTVENQVFYIDNQGNIVDVVDY